MTASYDQKPTDFLLEQVAPFAAVSPTIGMIAFGAYLMGQGDRFAGTVDALVPSLNTLENSPEASTCLLPNDGLSIERINDPWQVTDENARQFWRWQLRERAELQRDRPT